MKLWKYSGSLLMATGGLHLLVAVAGGWDAWRNIIQDGFADSIGKDAERAYAFWFLMGGILLLFWGSTLQYYIRKEQKPVPLFLGYGLLLVSVVGCIMLPLSGFWLLIPQALIMIGGHFDGGKGDIPCADDQNLKG